MAADAEEQIDKVEALPTILLEKARRLKGKRVDIIMLTSYQGSWGRGGEWR